MASESVDRVLPVLAKTGKPALLMENGIGIPSRDQGRRQGDALYCFIHSASGHDMLPVLIIGVQRDTSFVR